MKIFEQVIKTSVELIKLPIALTKDVFTLGNQIINPGDDTFTEKQLDKIKKASED